MPTYGSIWNDPDWLKLMHELSKTQPKVKAKPIDPIESASDEQLILEMIERGYAVAKMPAEKLAEEL